MKNEIKGKAKSKYKAGIGTHFQTKYDIKFENTNKLLFLNFSSISKYSTALLFNINLRFSTHS